MLHRKSPMLAVVRMLTISINRHCGDPSHNHEYRGRSSYTTWEACTALVAQSVQCDVKATAMVRLATEADAAKFMAEQVARRYHATVPRSWPGAPYGHFTVPLAVELRLGAEPEPHQVIHLSAAREQTQERSALIDRHIASFGDWSGEAEVQRARLAKARQELWQALALHEVRGLVAAERAEANRTKAEQALAQEQRRISGNALTPLKQPVTDQLIDETADLIARLAET